MAGVSPTTTNGIVLTTNATSISYSNRLSVTDQFSYQLSDGRGGTATGVVTIVNVGSNPAAEFVGLPAINAGSVVLHFSAVPGWTYHLERSTNLSTWTTILTTVAPPGGFFDYTDDFHDLSEPPPTALYRLRWAP